MATSSHLQLATLPLQGKGEPEQHHSGNHSKPEGLRDYAKKGQQVWLSLYPSPRLPNF